MLDHKKGANQDKMKRSFHAQLSKVKELSSDEEETTSYVNNKKE